MADFPQARFHHAVISTFGRESPIDMVTNNIPTVANLGGSAAWPSANLAIFTPIRIWAPFLAKIVWWANGTGVAGNTDCGIYTADGTLLANAGSTAQSGTSTIQTVTLSTAQLLVPGTYYIAMNASTVTTAQYQRAAAIANIAIEAGYAQQAVGAVALPATATFATMAQAFEPLCGIASTTVI